MYIIEICFFFTFTTSMLLFINMFISRHSKTFVQIYTLGLIIYGTITHSIRTRNLNEFLVSQHIYLWYSIVL